jgi:hypothetical protein
MLFPMGDAAPIMLSLACYDSLLVHGIVEDQGKVVRWGDLLYRLKLLHYCLG